VISARSSPPMNAGTSSRPQTMLQNNGPMI
jgi:hypothetical protein